MQFAWKAFLYKVFDFLKNHVPDETQDTCSSVVELRRLLQCNGGTSEEKPRTIPDSWANRYIIYVQSCNTVFIETIKISFFFVKKFCGQSSKYQIKSANIFMHSCTHACGHTNLAVVLAYAPNLYPPIIFSFQ